MFFCAASVGCITNILYCCSTHCPNLTVPFQARLRLWRFIRLHWAEILEKFGAGTFMIDNIIQEVVSRFTTQLELDEVRDHTILTVRLFSNEASK